MIEGLGLVVKGFEVTCECLGFTVPVKGVGLRGY